MKNTWTLDHYLILLAECSFLTPTDKWALLGSVYPDLIAELDLPWLAKIRLNSEKARRFSHFVAISGRDIINSYDLDPVDRLTFFDPSYPDPLRHIYAPPLLLYYKGDLTLLDRTILGVVGPRRPSDYSLTGIRTLLPGLIQKDLVISSGLAMGVDAWAHQAAIYFGGSTIAVVATGLDLAYPASNRKLQELIGQKHLVISEYPYGCRAQKWHFPERNRIIAGISRGILVTEARKQSGTLITAQLALEEGRDVFALPGRIDSPLSEGCNLLISQGARPVTHQEDILKDWSLQK